MDNEKHLRENGLDLKEWNNKSCPGRGGEIQPIEQCEYFTPTIFLLFEVRLRIILDGSTSALPPGPPVCVAADCDRYNFKQTGADEANF